MEGGGWGWGRGRAEPREGWGLCRAGLALGRREG